MISIIIPCYWSSKHLMELTRDCVKSVDHYTELEYEFVVVDDGSPNKVTDPEVIVLPHNKGYAAAVNVGVKASIGDTLVILNNDTEVCPGWLEALTDPLEDGYDIMSIRTSDSSGFLTEDRITDNDKFGSVFAIKRPVWDALGGFDESFHGYFTDLDLYRRARLEGFKIGKNHNCVILHHGKSTYKEIDTSDKEYIESHEIYKQKHGVDVTPHPDSW